MSLKAIAGAAGKISNTVNGNNLTNSLSKSVFGNSRFLRNHERTHDTIVSEISTIQNTLTDLASAAGMKNNMYVIGRIDQTEAGEGVWDRVSNQITGYAQRAISYWTDNGTQNGVIIDGFDNFKGNISVALPDMPVMYDTSVVNQVVRNANRVSMRVYVDLMHSDDLVQNVIQAFANEFAGLSGTIMNAVSGNTLNRAQRALNSLQWIQENGQPFKVYTPHKVYENMLIESIVPINDQKMNEILCADITFKEIIATQSLGYASKTTARMAPDAPVNAFAKAVGWIS